MKKLILSASICIASSSAFGSVVDVNKILITSNGPDYLQISEVVAISGSVDVATSSNGATAVDDGTGFWPGTPTPDTGFAIDGVGPSDFPFIYHSDSPFEGEFLLITLDDSYTIESLSIFGRADGFSFRDVYDVQLLDASDQLLFSATSVSANNADNEGVVNLSVIPIPAAAWLFVSAIAGLGWFRRMSHN